eukprot:GILK01007445.1.p1 GENE.GILK01007445.1~~GILK01007445.1.p1  ORF type:complete len:799 (-),score=114.96 GILK01007445.1:135-2531(-)
MGQAVSKSLFRNSCQKEERDDTNVRVLAPIKKKRYTRPAEENDSGRAGTATVMDVLDNIEAAEFDVDTSKILHEEDCNNDNYFSAEEQLAYDRKIAGEEVKRPVRKHTIRWQRGELLGTGSFGRVHLGLNLDTGELHAVKQVALGGVYDHHVAERVKSLELEIALLSNLQHENIVRYYGTSQDEEYLNIFLEYIAGGSIAHLLGKFGRFNETLIRVYTRQILLGLEYLHSHRVIHRDIKGGNVLVDNNGICKLVDFGASKKIAELADTENFKSLKGTPYWMAPEVIKQTGHGRQADIWSVGCTVLEMATGKPPWSHFTSQVSALFHIAASKTPPPIPDFLSADAHDFLLLCFKRNPKERANVTRLLRHPFITNLVPPNKSISNPYESGRRPSISNDDKSSDKDRIANPIEKATTPLVEKQAVPISDKFDRDVPSLRERRQTDDVHIYQNGSNGNFNGNGLFVKIPAPPVIVSQPSSPAANTQNLSFDFPTGGMRSSSDTNFNQADSPSNRMRAAFGDPGQDHFETRTIAPKGLRPLVKPVFPFEKSTHKVTNITNNGRGLTVVKATVISPTDNDAPVVAVADVQFTPTVEQPSPAWADERRKSSNSGRFGGNRSTGKVFVQSVNDMHVFKTIQARPDVVQVLPESINVMTPPAPVAVVSSSPNGAANMVHVDFPEPEHFPLYSTSSFQARLPPVVSVPVLSAAPQPAAAGFEGAHASAGVGTNQSAFQGAQATVIGTNTHTVRVYGDTRHESLDPRLRNESRRLQLHQMKLRETQERNKLQWEKELAEEKEKQRRQYS